MYYSVLPFLVGYLAAEEVANYSKWFGHMFLDMLVDGVDTMKDNITNNRLVDYNYDDDFRR